MVISVLSQYALFVGPCSDLMFKLNILVELFWDRVDLFVGTQRREIDIVEIFIDGRYTIDSFYQWFIKWYHFWTIWLWLNQLHSFYPYVCWEHQFIVRFLVEHELVYIEWRFLRDRWFIYHFMLVGLVEICFHLFGRSLS